MNAIKASILQILTQRESYGLEIRDHLHEMTGRHELLLAGQVYPALRQLEADGLVMSFDGPPVAVRGGRPRRYYRLTDAGRGAAA